MTPAFPDFPEIDTARLRLRQIVSSDIPVLFAIHHDADTMRWYGVEPLADLAQAAMVVEAFSGWFENGTGFRWGLERHEDHRLIGSCGLFRWNKSWQCCVIGYELARDCQGRGYMREAAEAILEFGFTRMHLHRVQAEAHPRNAASIRLAQRLGFQLEGVHREQGYWGGQFHDLNCYSLLESEWRNRKT